MEPSAETPPSTPIEEMSPTPLSEQQSDTLEPDEFPPKEEKKRNVGTEQQRKELYFIADTLRNRKIEAALAKHASGDTLGNGEKKLLELHQLGNKEDGQYINETEEEIKDNSIPFTEGKPVFIEVSEGKKLQLLSVTGRKTYEDGSSYFNCQFKRDEGTIIGRDILVTEIMKAQYLSETDVIIQDFSPAEQQLLNLQANILRDGQDSLKSQNVDGVNKLISEVSEEQGIITASDIEGLLESQVTTISPEQQDQLQNVRRKLENINVMTDPDQFAEVLGVFGFNKEGITARVDNLGQELQQLQAELTKNPADGTFQQKVSEKEDELGLWQSLQEQLPDEPNMDTYFENVRTGKVTVETRKEITKAIREGNVDGILARIIPELMDDPNDTPEQKAEKDAKKNELAGKLAMGGLIGLGAILALMYQVVSIESKEIKKSLR